MSDDVFLVPHTHWDREWYEPFQRFRLRLVDLMDDVIGRAQRDPGFRFTLDGQMAVVQDYLEARPEQRTAIQSALNETFSANVALRFETAPEVVSGIELTANGQRVAWSIGDYLTTLEKSIDELLASPGGGVVKA